LRAPKVDINSIAVILHVLCGLEQSFRIITAELYNEWAVLRMWAEKLSPIPLTFGKHPTV
jgi:hypothetical protein